MPAVFPPWCLASSEKCFLPWHHFLSKVVITRTFSQTNWRNHVYQVAKWNCQGLRFYKGSNFPFFCWFLNGHYNSAALYCAALDQLIQFYAITWQIVTTWLHLVRCVAPQHRDRIVTTGYSDSTIYLYIRPKRDKVSTVRPSVRNGGRGQLIVANDVTMRMTSQWAVPAVRSRFRPRGSRGANDVIMRTTSQ